MIDYSAADETVMPTNDELAEISQLADEQVRIEKQVADAEEHLRNLKNALWKWKTEVLPEAMKKVGLSEFKLSNGGTVTIKDDMNVNVSPDKKPAFHEWLREHKHGDIIKNKVAFMFGMGEDAARSEVLKLANDRGWDYEAAESVHAATLKAWAKAQKESDNPLLPSDDIMTIFEYSVAKVEPPKKPRKPRKRKT